nr:MAG TPA: Integrase [Caudoviricetes sp.]
MAKKYKINRKFRFEGKDYWIHADTEKEFIEKKIRKQIELEDGRKKIDKNMLFKDWIDEWFVTYVEPTVSVDTAYSYRNVLKNHVLPVLGTMRLSDIRPLHVQNMLNNMTARSKKMLKRVKQLTDNALEDARRNRLLIENPAKDVVVPKGNESTRRSITDYEREHILNVCQHHRAGTFIYLMLYAGLRTGEVCCLKWKDVHFDESYIQVESTLKRIGKVEGVTKTEAGVRKVPLSKPLRDWLYPLRKSAFDYVVTKTNGKRMDFSAVQSMWRSFKHDLNIDMGCETYNDKVLPPYRVASDLVMYCFRHTFCTDLQDAGVPLNVAKELMGHADVSVTAKIYTHGTKRSLDAALNRMNEFHRVYNE